MNYQKYSSTAIAFFLYLVLSTLLWFFSSSNILSLVFLVAVLFVPDKQPLDRPLEVPEYLLMLFALSYFLSNLLTPDYAMNLELVSYWLSGLLVYFLLYKFLDFDRDWTLIAFAFVVSAAILGAVLLWNRLVLAISDPVELINQAAHPLLQAPNDALYLALTSPFCLALFLKGKASVMGIVSVITLVIILLAGLVLQSRSAVVAMLIALYLFLFLGRARLMGMATTLVLVVAVVLNIVLDTGIANKFTQLPTSRLPLWRAAWSSFLEHPWLGNGQSNFLGYYSHYVTENTFPAWMELDIRSIPWPHNLYLELLAAGGIITFLLFVAWVGSVISLASSGSDKYARYSITSALAVFFIAAMIELTFLRIWVILMLCSLLVMYRLSTIPESRGSELLI